MKNYQQFINEGIIPKKKKGTKKTFVPFILPKTIDLSGTTIDRVRVR